MQARDAFSSSAAAGWGPLEHLSNLRVAHSRASGVSEHRACQQGLQFAVPDFRTASVPRRPFIGPLAAVVLLLSVFRMYRRDYLATS